MLAHLPTFVKQTVKEVWKKYHPKSFLSFYLKNRLGYDNEIELIPWLCDKHSIAIDIGAHHGLYFPNLSIYSKFVHAFEPNPDLYSFVSRAYGLKNIKTHPIALSDKNGESILRIPESLLGLATIEPENTLNSSEIPTQEKIKEIKVETRTLDSYSFDSVSFIKVDVEGHEFAVLKGAENILKNNFSSIVVEIKEIHKPNEYQLVSNFLNSLGYCGYFYCEKKLYDISLHHKVIKQSKQDSRFYGGNFVFLHPRRTDQLPQKFHDLFKSK